jgi:hypothetical protein
MQVILTPTAVADMFGTGLNGFQDSVPGPPTELSAEWFNSMQMEIVSVLVNQGYALDGLLFDQLDFALNNFSFDGSVAIQSGGTLSILGGGTLYLEGGSQFYADSTSSFSVNTSDAEFLKDLVIGDSSGDALVVTSTSTFQSPVFFNGNVDIGNNVADALTVTATTSFLNTTNIRGALLILGASGGSLSTDPTAVVQINGQLEVTGRLTVGSGTSIAARDLSVDGSNNLRYRDASATKYVHVNSSGWVKGHGQTATAGAAALTLSFDTSVAVAPIVASNLDIEASAWVTRVGGGVVTVSLTEVGVGQIGTNATFLVVAPGGSAQTQICFSRTHAASTTPRTYRFTVDGGAANVTVTQGRITATPTT